MQPQIRHQCYRRIFQLHKAFLIALFFAAAIGHAQGIPGLTPLPKVTLTKATTPDAKTVVLTYAVAGASPNSIHFDLYRSATSNATTNSILSADDANPADLTIGEHTVSFTPVAGLPPNTASPYVVVVATSGGKKSTVYFRKFLIGVIAHGFDRWAFANTLSPVSLVSVPQWETTMARSLKLMDNYDDVIAFNWTQTCAAPRPGMAVQAGHELATEVLAKTVIRKPAPRRCRRPAFHSPQPRRSSRHRGHQRPGRARPIVSRQLRRTHPPRPPPRQQLLCRQLRANQQSRLTLGQLRQRLQKSTNPSRANSPHASCALPASRSRPARNHSPRNQESRSLVPTHPDKLLQPPRSGTRNESMGHSRPTRPGRSKRPANPTHRQNKLLRSHRPQPDPNPLPNPNSRNRQPQSPASIVNETHLLTLGAFIGAQFRFTPKFHHPKRQRRATIPARPQNDCDKSPQTQAPTARRYPSPGQRPGKAIQWKKTRAESPLYPI